MRAAALEPSLVEEHRARRVAGVSPAAARAALRRGARPARPDQVGAHRADSEPHQPGDELRSGEPHRRCGLRGTRTLAGGPRDPHRTPHPRARPLARAGGARARLPCPRAAAVRPASRIGAAFGCIDGGVRARQLALRQALARSRVDRARAASHRAGLAHRAAAGRRGGAGARAALAAGLGRARRGLAADAPGRIGRPHGRSTGRGRCRQRPEPHRGGARPTACAALQLPDGVAHRAAGSPWPRSSGVGRRSAGAVDGSGLGSVVRRHGGAVL